MTADDRRTLRQQARLVWWPRWRRRALFLAGGLVVGALTVAMAKLADSAQVAFHLLVARWSWAPFVLAPGGFALAAWLTRTFFPERRAVASRR